MIFEVECDERTNEERTNEERTNEERTNGPDAHTYCLFYSIRWSTSPHWSRDCPRWSSASAADTVSPSSFLDEEHLHKRACQSHVCMSVVIC